jgi:hypothetical protein
VVVGIENIGKLQLTALSCSAWLVAAMQSTALTTV